MGSNHVEVLPPKPVLEVSEAQNSKEMIELEKQRKFKIENLYYYPLGVTKYL